MNNNALTSVVSNVRKCTLVQRIGGISQIYGLMVESNGPDVFLGEECEIYRKKYGNKVRAEVVALKNDKVILMPYGDLRGVSYGDEVLATGRAVSVPVGEELLGRVIDGFGNPLDDKPRPLCDERYSLYGEPINPLSRQRITKILNTGVKAIDCLLTVGRGQRVGIFSGSGVGKSSLLGMIARHMDADVNVIAMVGERGREVMEFISEVLGPEGLKKSIVVVATSDQPALKRTHAAFAATAIAEYFRNRGQHVVLTMDSLTRFAMAQREIGLAVGEPPTSRGYTPSVFAILPRLLERAGTTASGGTITAFYSVLVEGDDMNDPIADNVRAILDGHIVLKRELANKNVYPPIDILSSTSRLMHSLTTADERKMANEAVRLLSQYTESRDMVELGVYRAGTNPQLDLAIKIAPKLQEYFTQNIDAEFTREQSMHGIREILSR
jgi:flagellum-specific ATP synthase